MRILLIAALPSLLLAACGDDGPGGTPDAADNGFERPTVTLQANREISEDMWETLGAADMSCLDTAPTDTATTLAVTLNLVVKDFQSGNAVPSATVTVFPGADHNSPFDTQTSDTSANLTVTIPSGQKRFGYRMTSSTSMPTFLLNQVVEPSVAIQPTGTCAPSPCRAKIQSVSNATAATLPALIGQTRTPGTGVVAGALRDCQNREVSGFIATMSSTPATASTIAGSEAYYFDSGVGLPAHHHQQHFASEDGLFMIIQIPSATPTGYVQMWGFPSDGDLSSGQLKLLAELQVPVLADTVITGSYEPLRQ